MVERHIDPLDQASEATAEMVAGAVEARRLAAAPQQVPNAEGIYPHTHCVEEDCGVELPLERLKLGRIRCVDCQEIIEKRAKSRGR